MQVLISQWFRLHHIGITQGEGKSHDAGITQGEGKPHDAGITQGGWENAENTLYL